MRPEITGCKRPSDKRNSPSDAPNAETEGAMPLLYELRAFPMFTDLYDEEIEKIISLCTFEEHKEESRIFGDQDPEAIYFILKGRVSFQIYEQGKNLDYRSLDDCGIVYEKMFDSEFSRRFSMTALTPSQSMVLPTDKLFSLFRQDPKIYGILMTNLMQQMFKDSTIANGLIARIFFSNTIKIGLPIYPVSKRNVWNQQQRNRKVTASSEIRKDETSDENKKAG